MPPMVPASACVAILGFAALGLFAVPSAAAPPSDGWRIRIEATRPGLVDKGRVILGASATAADGFDTFDDPHPPVFASRFLDAFTQHAQNDPGWENQPRPAMRYRADYGSPLGAGDRTLDFFVDTDQAASVTLTWALAPDVDLSQHFITLKDVGANVTVDMWALPSYVYAAAAGPRHFQVILVGGFTAPPIAHDQSLTVDEDTSLPITLTATDPEGDPLTFRIVTAASHGTLLGVPPSITYVPDANFNGLDTFQFVANDGQRDSNTATVSVTVEPVNDPPGTVIQLVETDEAVAVAITLLAPDVDGDPLTYAVTSSPAHGTLTGTAPALTYTPAPDFAGSDSFNFVAHDGLAFSGTSTVQITVRAINDPPRAAFTVRGPERRAATWDNNLGSAFEGASVAAYSSQVLPSFVAANILDDNPGTSWRTVPGLITDQFAIVQLPGNAPRTIDRVRLLNPSTGTEGVKNFEVRVSTTTADPGSFTTVLTDRALINDRLQEFRLPAPVPARFVQLLARDNHGSTSAISLRGFEIVDATLPGVPSHLQLPANAALASEGGSATATSQNANAPADRVIDGFPNTNWSSLTGQPPANQQLTVQLLRVYTIDRVRLIGNSATTTVRNFTIEVSATPDPGAFVPVFSGTALNNNTLQEFIFPGGAVPARRVRLTATTNYGSTSAVTLFELQVIPVAAALSSFSSARDANSRPELILDNNTSTAWFSATSRVTDEFVKIRLADSALVDRVHLLASTAATPDGPRDFEIWTSTTTDDDGAFVRVLQATAANTGGLQEFAFPGGPVRATHLKLLVRNNHGGTTIRVGSLEVPAMTGDGNIISLPGGLVNSLRPESPSLIANGAAVVTYSSATDAAHAPAAMLTYQTGIAWTTTALTGQFAVIQLAGGGSTAWRVSGSLPPGAPTA